MALSTPRLPRGVSLLPGTNGHAKSRLHDSNCVYLFLKMP